MLKRIAAFSITLGACAFAALLWQSSVMEQERLQEFANMSKEAGAANLAALQITALWTRAFATAAIVIMAAAVIGALLAYHIFQDVRAEAAAGRDGLANLRQLQSAQLVPAFVLEAKGGEPQGLEITAENMGLSPALRCQCWVDVTDHIPGEMPDDRRFTAPQSLKEGEKRGFAYVNFATDPLIKIEKLESYYVIGKFKYSTIFGIWEERAFCFGFDEGGVEGQFVASDKTPEEWG